MPARLTAHHRIDGPHKCPPQPPSSHRLLPQIQLHPSELDQRPDHRRHIGDRRQHTLDHEQRPRFTRMQPGKGQLKQPRQKKRHHLPRGDLGGSGEVIGEVRPGTPKDTAEGDVEEAGGVERLSAHVEDGDDGPDEDEDEGAVDSRRSASVDGESESICFPQSADFFPLILFFFSLLMRIILTRHDRIWDLSR